MRAKDGKCITFCRRRKSNSKHFLGLYIYKCIFFFQPKHSKERPKVEMCKIDYAPFTYVLSIDQLEADKTLINCDWFEPSTSSNHHQSSNNLIAHKDF